MVSEFINGCKRGYIMPNGHNLDSPDGSIKHRELLDKYKSEFLDKDEYFPYYYEKFKNELLKRNVITQTTSDEAILGLYVIQVLGWVKVGMANDVKTLTYPDIPEDTNNYLTYRFVDNIRKSYRNLNYKNVIKYEYLADNIKYEEGIDNLVR